MKCPVCDQENSTMLCSQCGFDASRDYEQYPTFGPIKKALSVSAMRRDLLVQDQEKIDQINQLLITLLAVRYQKLIEEDPFVRAASHRLSHLKSKLDQEKAASRRALSSSRESARREQERLESELNSMIQAKNALSKDLDYWKGSHRSQTQQNTSQILQLKALEQQNSDLKYNNSKLKSSNSKLKQSLDAANSKIAELEAALEAERNKGVLSRIFNR